MHDGNSAEDRLRLLDSVLSCASFDQIADRVLEPMASALQASSAVFLGFVDRAGVGVSVGRNRYVGSRPWSVEAYCERFFEADPLMRGQRRAFLLEGQADARSIDRLPETRAVQDSEYYRRFLQPSDIAHVVGVAIPFCSVLGRELLCLGFHRSCASMPFGGREIALLDRLGAAVASTLTGLAALEALPLSATLIEQLAAPARRRLSGAGRGSDRAPRERRGSPRARHRAARRRYAREPARRAAPAPAPAAPRGGDPAQHFTLRRHDDGIAVAVTALAVATINGLRLIVSTKAQPAAAVDEDCRGLGLSRREIEVARLVCAGCGNCEIAQLLGISIRTVENHLRAIYSKVGVHSRTRLAARLRR